MSGFLGQGVTTTVGSSLMQSRQAGVAKAAYALYEACHLSKPGVVFAISSEDYQESVNSFIYQSDHFTGDRDSIENSRSFLKKALISVFIFNVLLVACYAYLSNYVVMEFLVLPTVICAVCDMFGLIGGLVLFVDTIDRFSAKEKRKALLKRVPLNATAFSEEIATEGTNPTRDGMIGILSSAIVAAGGRIEREKKDSQHERADLNLCVGQVMQTPDSSHRVIKSIAAYTGEQLGQARDRSGLPTVLGCLLELAAMVDEATLLDGVVVVLLAHEEGGERSIDALMAEGTDLANGLKTSLAWPDLAARDALYKKVGLDQVVGLLALQPVQHDATGALYRIGEESRTLCYLRVQDEVVGGDSQPLVHWIGVPQHIATAREGVAWSFQLGARDYQPTVEV